MKKFGNGLLVRIITVYTGYKTDQNQFTQSLHQVYIISHDRTVYPYWQKVYKLYTLGLHEIKTLTQSVNMAKLVYASLH